MKKLKAKGKIKEFIKEYSLELYSTSSYEKAKKFISKLDRFKACAADIETSGFNFWQHKMIGFAIAVSDTQAVYIITREMTDEQIKDLIATYNKKVKNSYMWNYYFDKSFTLGRYGEGFKCTHDGLIYAHTLFNHRKLQGKGLSLKDFTKDFLPFGDYEEELNIEKRNLIKNLKIKTKDFSYALLSDDTLAPYACMDVITTYALTESLQDYAKTRITTQSWDKLPNLLQLKHDVTEVYIKAKVRGIKVDREKILELSFGWQKELKSLYSKLNNLTLMQQFKAIYELEEFNPRSSKQKISLFFKFLNFPIIETTE